MSESQQPAPRRRASQFTPAELDAMRRRRNHRYWLAAFICMLVFVGAIWALLEKTKWSAGPSAAITAERGVRT